jgi:hypothetical protein
MTEKIRLAQAAVSTQEIEEISKVLAKYNLGICVPHMHTEAGEELVSLPPGVVALERKLQVSFVDPAIAGDTEPVAWRWNGTRLEVCGSCCTAD